MSSRSEVQLHGIQYGTSTGGCLAVRDDMSVIDVGCLVGGYDRSHRFLDGLGFARFSKSETATYELLMRF